MGVKRKIKRNTYGDLVSLEQAFDEFISEKEAKNLSDSTIHNYMQSFELFTRFCNFPQDAAAEDITLQHFYRWINSLKKEGVKPTSINHYLRDCRAFVYWCMDTERGYISTPYKIQMIECQEEQLKFFTDEEIIALLEKPKKTDPFADWRMWTIVNWVLGTGNRSSTLCEVRLSDIDFTNDDIVLRHTKNKKAQVIPLSPALKMALKEYIKIWRKSADFDGYLFPNIGEEQLTTNALRHAFSRYCEARGVEKTNIHGLRHSFARGWIKNNGKVLALQNILGHSTLEMTKKYVKLFSEDIKEDYDKFSPLDTMKRSSKRTHMVKRA